MAGAGEIGDRPEAGGRDWRRLGADAEVEAAEGLGVYHQRQVPAGRRFGSRWPGGLSGDEAPAHGDQEHLDAGGAGNMVAGRGRGERLGARGRPRLRASGCGSDEDRCHRPGWPIGAGACVVRRWCRRHMDAARATLRPPRSRSPAPRSGAGRAPTPSRGRGRRPAVWRTITA